MISALYNKETRMQTKRLLTQAEQLFLLKERTAMFSPCYCPEGTATKLFLSTSDHAEVESITDKAAGADTIASKPFLYETVFLKKSPHRDVSRCSSALHKS